MNKNHLKLALELERCFPKEILALFVIQVLSMMRSMLDIIKLP